ncbi:MAG TPA: phosphotransferase [Blastocatellia bacterium]|nr:phosphotransferase [Blastocatellia bacterium]
MMVTSSETTLSGNVIEIAARHLNGAPADLSITRLSGDASTRSYFRAQSASASVILALYAEPFDEAESAASRLARLEAANPAVRLTFANDPCAHVEVTELLKESGLPVPAVLAVSGRDSLLLIEDVGDLRLQDWLADHAGDEATSAYRRAIELIVKIQEATGRALSPDSICSRLAFDAAKLRWELGFFFANYFNRYLGMRLDAATANGVQEDFKAISAELSARPRVLAHRDFHTRNLMMRASEMIIIDHQDARMGPASYDVASLLADPYTALDSDVAGEMVERFIELKAGSTLGLDDVEEFRRELELMTVQRMLKAIGTYSSQAAVANNPVYIPYIEPAIERACRSMSALGRFDTTRALLERTRQVEKQ